MGSAILDGCYRYVLTRDADPFGVGDFVMVMLNPSTADANADDPTIRRCVGFATRYGCRRLVVVNLYAVRATNPDDIWTAQDPVGRENDRHIAEACAAARIIVAAWGVPANGAVERRADAVAQTIALHQDLWTLGLSKGGHPRHPLYLKSASEPTLWRPAKCSPTPSRDGGAAKGNNEGGSRE